jgi:hypothetical protein
VSLVKPTVKSGSRGFIQNLFCNFWTFLQVSTNFESLKQFLLFKTIGKTIKFSAQYRAENWLQVTSHGGWRPVLRGRPTSRLGRGGVSTDGAPAASQRRGSPREHQRGSGVTSDKSGGVARTRAAGRWEGGRRVPEQRHSPAGRELRWSSAMRSCSSRGARG